MSSIQRECRISGKVFSISEKDQAFYGRLNVPLPTLCPDERMRRRLANRNERHLYHRKCELTGKQIISSTRPEAPYSIYSIDAWWSDDWNPLDYGQDIDWDRPFFEQLIELKEKVPRLALQQQKPMQNSEYCNCASRNKNCYLVFSTNHCEDCYYGSWINFSKDCVDNETCQNNELCYETVDCEKCYRVAYGEESVQCSDSAFIKNCTGSDHLLFCTNLNRASYHVFNKKVSPEEFERVRQELQLDTHSGWKRAVEKFEAFKKEMYVRSLYGVQNEDVTGNHVSQSRRCRSVYEVIGCEDVSYGNNLEVNVKDCMDYSYWGMNASLIYEAHACGYDIHHLRFCNLCWDGCSDLTYCDHCFSSKDCFGCVGLKKDRYCILNKQYTEEEYLELVPRLIEHMKKHGEWGEFFPAEFAAFAYNETLAQEWFPLDAAEAKALGYQWKEEAQKSNDYQGPRPEIPDSIADVDESICQQILECEVSGKLYKIIPQELAFYEKLSLPIPRRCPDQRHADRRKRRNPRKLWARNCSDCKIDVQTSYAPERPEILLCEDCYAKRVIHG